MADHRLFSLYAPEALGGPELDPLTAFRVVEAISKADGSAGWCVFNGSAVTSAIARLTVTAAREIFGDPPEILGSGSARPEGTATVTEGGYLINGRWNYLSGIDHSTALFLNCRLLNHDGSPALNEDGSPATRVARGSGGCRHGAQHLDHPGNARHRQQRLRVRQRIRPDPPHLHARRSFPSPRPAVQPGPDLHPHQLDPRRPATPWAWLAAR